MRPTSSLLGASRLPLTPKRGNKDYYKGTRQAYAPGGGHRTGPPGAFVVGGKAKYRLVDSKVRYFVGPGIDKIESSLLKPYVTTNNVSLPPSKLPSFSPMVPPPRRGEIVRPRDVTAWSKAYHGLATPERHALIMDARRKWYDALVKRYPAHQGEEEETMTAAVETKADKAKSS